jgi:hypothetical protein
MNVLIRFITRSKRKTQDHVAESVLAEGAAPQSTDSPTNGQNAGAPDIEQRPSGQVEGPAEIPEQAPSSSIATAIDNGVNSEGEIAPTQQLGVLSLKLSDIAVTVLVPAIAFAAVYAYRAGYYGFFSVPTDSLTIDWSTVLNSAGGLRAAAFSLLLPMALTILSWGDVTDEDFKRLRAWFYLLIIVDSSIFVTVPGLGLLILNGIAFSIMRFSQWRRRKSGKATRPEILDPYGSVVDAILIYFGKRTLVVLVAALFSIAAF